ncbi:MAG: hypothetical protein RH917_06795 [Lacipirellulaceae bacterium]
MAKTSTARKTKSTSKKTASSTKAKTASAKKRTAKKPAAKKSAKPRKAKPPGEEEVTIDRRRGQRREEATDAAPKAERRDKVQRRRQIDPTTCERDYSEAEVEFMNAMDEYKRTSGRMFPTCSEVLEVITSIGYAKVTPAELAILGRAPVAQETEEGTVEEGNEEAGEFAEEAELVS